mgnify:CR=1 FL=1
MKKILETYRKKSLRELEKDINKLKKEIAQLRLEFKINPPKDTNLLSKMRKQLAQMLTIYQEKKLEGDLKKELES